jgi:hypothetical protein
MRPVGVVLQITKRGIDVLKAVGRHCERWKPEPIPVNIQSLIHDLELNQVVRGIRKILPEAVITNGKHLSKINDGNFSKIPDAVLELPVSSLEEAKIIIRPDVGLKMDRAMRVALELELTAKSDRRYREIISNYRLSREVDHVLYLSQDRSVFRKIQSVIAGAPIKGEIKLHSGIFSFLDLFAIDCKADKIEDEKFQQQLSEVS